MKIRQTEIRSFLVLLAISTAIILGVFEGLAISQEKLGNYIYSITAQPFLAQSSVTTHASKIEYTANLLKK